MFGSDWPVCLLAASYAEVVAVADDLLAGLDEAERAQVWSGTAERWYGLEPR
jgi:L-fuconolactonase